MHDRIQITFQHRSHDPELKALARHEAVRLMAQDLSITWCRVVIGYQMDQSNMHGSVGGTYVKILFTLPGCTLVVRHRPQTPWARDDPAEAIMMAFESATGMLHNYQGKKAHGAPEPQEKHPFFVPMGSPVPQLV